MTQSARQTARRSRQPKYATREDGRPPLLQWERGVVWGRGRGAAPAQEVALWHVKLRACALEVVLDCGNFIAVGRPAKVSLRLGFGCLD